MPRFIDIGGTVPIAAAAEARAAINAPGNGGVIVDFTDYGACDGVTDDRAAFVSALAVLDSAGGGTLQLPPTDIAITMNALPTFDIPANTTVRGTRGATRLLLSSTSDDVYLALVGSAGDNVAFEGITFLRDTNCTGFLFYPDGYDGFHVRDCVVDGQRDIYDKTFHGWVLHRENFVSPKQNITIIDSLVTKTSYGLLHGNGAVGDIHTIVVDNCDFTANYSDHLEFNAPLGEMTNVVVSNCRFTDLRSESLFSALAIGFATVKGAVVRDCYFDTTYSDAIHLEWSCENILIANNRFVNCATSEEVGVTGLDRAAINIMARCRDVVVTGNVIDHRPNTNTNGLHAITVRNYTGGVSLLGETCVPPWRITITDNIIHCGENFGGIWACDIADLTIKGNRIVGDGAVSGGAWDDGNIRAGIMADGTNTVIADNAVSGFRYGITGPLVEDLNGAGGISLDFNERRALGNPGSVTGNMISDCYMGLVAVSAGATTISGNTMFNCERPMAVGQREFPAEPCAISGNSAKGCTYPLEVGGKLVVKRVAGGSTVTTGTGKSLTVTDTLMTLPIGSVIRFSGGGCLRLATAEAVAQLYDGSTAYTLSGKVYGADIAADEWGLAHGLSHSSTDSDSLVSVVGNADEAIGDYPLDVYHDLKYGEASLPRIAVSADNLTLATSVVYLTYFTARKTETISKVRSVSGAVAHVGATTCQIGVYWEDEYGNLTRMAQTANTTGLWSAINTQYTTDLEAPFLKRAGQRYAVAVTSSGHSTAPQIHGISSSAMKAELKEPHRLSALVASASLGTFWENSAGLQLSSSLHYVALEP